MLVYRNDNPTHFLTAVRSIFNQTVKPSEIVLVVDGPIPDALEEAIIALQNEISFLKLVRFATNKGHGVARRSSLDNCSNDIVALMDADDISLPHRFEEQLEILHSSNADIVGGNISEFINTPDNIVGQRVVPKTDTEIKKYIKYRCPFNQMTVMFKKEAYYKAGGYIDWYCDEDYYLWLRMYQKGCVFANTGTVLVNVRVGKDMYKRRGGWKYFKSEAKLQKYMWDNGIISLPLMCYNVLGRFVVQVAMPNSVRGFVFQKLFRKN